MKDVLVIGASNSSKSINQKFATMLAKQGDYDFFDTRELNIPLYQADIEENEGFPQEMIDFLNLIKQYPKLVIVSPEHNGYTTAFFKSITDWMSRYERFYFENIKLYIIGVTPGQKGAASVREALKTMYGFAGATIVGDYGIAHYKEDEDYTKVLDEIITQINNA